jgi:hypothetical protein
MKAPMRPAQSSRGGKTRRRRPKPTAAAPVAFSR